MAPGRRKATEADHRRVMLAAVWIEPAHRRGIARYARQAGWVLDVAQPDSIDLLAGWRGDGVICQLHPGEKRFVRLVRGLGAATVGMADYLPRMHVPRVLPDYAACGREAAEHFLQRSFRNFACFSVAPGRHSPLDGFLANVNRAGHGVTQCCWAQRKTGRSGYGPGDRRRWLTDRIAEMPKPLATLVLEHDLAVALLDSCADAGLLVPEQVAVLSVSEDDTMCELAPVPLSSIFHDHEAQAYRAAQLLDTMMAGTPVAPETTLVPPQRLRVRHSSDVTAIENVEVSRAIQFIRRNLHRRGLSVPDVAEDSTLARRSLDRAFGEHLGRTVAAEIARLRLDEATELLRGTDNTVLEIARSCGYSDAKHLRRALARATGLTPKAYRRGGD